MMDNEPNYETEINTDNDFVADEIQVADTEDVNGVEDFEGINPPVNPVGFGNITEEEYDTERDKRSSKTLYVVIIIALCVLVLVTALIVLHRYFPDLISFGEPTTGQSQGESLIPSLKEPDSEISGDKNNDILNPDANVNSDSSEGTDNNVNSNPSQSEDSVVNNATKLSVTEIYSSCVNSVVGISTEGTTTNIFGQVSKNASTGTGIVYSLDGYILTNYHVVESGSSHTVTLYNGKSYKAELVGFEAANDVAVLKIDATGLSPVVMGNSDKIAVGEDVIVIGNPLGELTYTLTRGVVSALNRVINTDSNPKNMFQIDAAVNSGNSGGPAFDSYGRVIGIVTAKYSADTVEGIGFCIPINDAVSIAEELVDHGFVRGKAGIEICATDSYLTYGNGWFSSYAIYGAKVTYVKSGGSADKAGMAVTDMIVSVDGAEITSVSELQAALRKKSIGDTIEIVAYHSEDGRNFDQKTYRLTLGESSPLNVPSDYSAEKYGVAM